MPRQTIHALAVCAFCVPLTPSAMAQAVTHPQPTYQDLDRGHLGSSVVLRLRPGFVLDRDGIVRTNLGQSAQAHAVEANAFFSSAGVCSALPVLHEAPGDFALAEALGLDRMYLLELDRDGFDSESFSGSASREAVVESAQPVLVGRTSDVPERPSDPGFPFQYALSNLGQTIDGVPGLMGADVNALKAWHLTTGSGHVTIAVLDAGISYVHPDLVYKIAETRNVTGAGSPSDANDVFNSHGTHVAGIAAAASDNQEGMTGMSWGSPIMAVKVANLLGFTSDVWLGQGLMWAADHEARVAVVSIGLDSGSDFLHAAVQYATQRGVVICASAGNSGQPGVKFPARYPETIAVAATDYLDQLAEFSTTGPEVTVAAPGVEILSTWDDIFSPPTYITQSGTSSAAPLVAGIVALMLSENPSLDTQRVIELLQWSVIDLGPTGRDNGFGLGRIDAHRAVGAAKGQYVCPADVNQNGSLEEADFSAWLAAFNANAPLADQNFNGSVEVADFSGFIANYANGCD